MTFTSIRADRARVRSNYRALTILPLRLGNMDALAAPRAPFAGIRPNWRVTPLRLAVGLTLLALGVRLIGLGMRPMWLDEAYSAWFSSRGWSELWSQVPTYEPHPPFYYSLLKLWRVVA